AGNAFAHRPVLMLRNDGFPFIGRRKAVKSRQAAGAENATAALVGAAATETFSANKACGSVQRAAVFGWKRAIATRQAGEMRARLENRQAPTRSRSGRNCPQMFMASPLQACWSDCSSARAPSGASVRHSSDSAIAVLIFIVPSRT